MSDDQLADAIRNLEPSGQSFDSPGARAAYLLGFSDARGLAAGLAAARAGDDIGTAPPSGGAVTYELEGYVGGKVPWRQYVELLPFDTPAEAEAARARCEANGRRSRVVEVVRRVVTRGPVGGGAGEETKP